MAVYTRQSSAGIVDGGTIEASDLNDEFDQVASAFLAPTFGVGTAGTDIVMTFDGETTDGVITWMEDEDYFKFSDGVLFATTEELYFRDTALKIYSSADGQLDIIADTEIQISATTIDINGAIALDGAITGATNITLSGELDAATLDVSGNADIDGTLEADAITVDGTTLAEYISDTAGAMFTSNTETGISATYQDGDNTVDLEVAAAQTTITSLLATDIKIGEDDQTKIDFETADEIHFFAANVEQVYLGDNVFGPQSDSDVDLGTTGVRWKDAFIDSVTTTGAVTVGGDLTVTGDDIVMATNTSGAALIADGTNFNPVVISGDATIATNGALTIANDAIDSQHYADGSIDNAHIADNAIDSEHYADGSIDNAHIADDAIDSEHYADGSIDNAHIADDAIDSEHYAAGSIDTAHIADNQITLGKMAGLARGKIIYGDASGDPAALAVGSNTYVLKSDGTDISWAAQSVSSLAADDLSAGDAAVTLSTSSGNITIDATANNSDIIFKGTDATADITMLTLAGADAGAATFNNKIVATELDISGDVDVDGTLEADAITIGSTAIGSIYGVVAGSSSIVTTGALNTGSITSGFGTIDTGASAITTTGLISGGSLDIDNVLINGTTIGHTDDTDLITVADSLLTIDGDVTITGGTPTLIIGDAGAEDAKIVFDGNAQDFHIGLDDTADDLVIGKGSALGTTPVITINEDLKTTFGGGAIGATYSVTGSGSITMNFDLYTNFQISANGNVALLNGTGTLTSGQSGVIVLIQDGTGSRTISTGSDYEWPAATLGTISTAANAVDVIPYYIDANDSILLGAPQIGFATPS